MPAPQPTPIYRMIHVENLEVCLRRGGLHSPNHCPNDGLVYRTIHRVDVQTSRRVTAVPCGPGGTVHDYIPFYFGVLSPMLLQLKTGQVPDYAEGQEPLVYLVSTAQAVAQAGVRLVFTDGHGLPAWTEFFDDLVHLDRVDWEMVTQWYWADTDEDMDRQRRKQAEFLVHRFLPWELVSGIGVRSEAMKQKVEVVLAGHPEALRKMVVMKPAWYY